MQVTFTLTAQATYELVLPATNDAIKVTAWLESKGASCDRYFRSNGTVKFVFISIPGTLVAQIASKYSLVDLTPVTEFRVNGFNKEEFEERNFGDVLSLLTPREIKKALVRMNSWKYVQEEMRNYGGTPVTILQSILDGIHMTSFDVLELVGRTTIPETVVYYTQTPVSPTAPDTIPDSDRLEDVRAYYKDQFDSCRNVQEIVARYKQFTSEDLTPEEEAILDSEFEFYLGCCGYCRDKNGNVVESCPEEEEVSDRPEEDVFEKVNIPLSYFHIPYFFADIYTDKEIKARYRQLSKIHHPDAGGNPEMFHALQSQYLQAIES
jgi:hypothetical protein